MKKNDTTSITIAVASFFTRGLFAIYWAVVTNVAALEIPAWRALSSAFFVGLMVLMVKDSMQIVKAFKNKKVMFMLFLSGMMIGSNWALYIYAITSERIVETSMAYYISPLITVAFSAIIFRTSVNKYQAISLILACIGVVNLFIGYGTIPYLALSIAITFSLYGLLRKVIQIGAMPGLFIESLYLSVPATFYLIYLASTGTMTITNATPMEVILVAICGLTTALPLVGFAYAAKNLSLATVGILQYLTPTVSFFIGVYMYKEPFTLSHLITFMFIWVGLIIYSVDGLIAYKKQKG